MSFIYDVLSLIIKVTIILSSISRGLEFWSVNYTSIYKNCESNAFKNITFSDEISNNWLNDLLGTNVYKAWIFFDNYY